MHTGIKNRPSTGPRRGAKAGRTKQYLPVGDPRRTHDLPMILCAAEAGKCPKKGKWMAYGERRDIVPRPGSPVRVCGRHLHGGHVAQLEAGAWRAAA